MFNYCRKLNRWKIHFILDGYLLYENTREFPAGYLFLEQPVKNKQKKRTGWMQKSHPEMLVGNSWTSLELNWHLLKLVFCHDPEIASFIDFLYPTMDLQQKCQTTTPNKKERLVNRLAFCWRKDIESSWFFSEHGLIWLNSISLLHRDFPHWLDGGCSPFSFASPTINISVAPGGSQGACFLVGKDRKCSV